MRPIIGILSTSEDTQDDYIKAVEKAGGTPVILPIVENIETLNPIIDKLNGIIFTGGSDINPHCYKDYPKYGLGKVFPRRDSFEVPLAQSILNNSNISILGICRGMQLLNVVTGGSLYQSLEKEKPNSFNHWMKDIYPRYHPSHEVTIDKSSKLFSILNKEKISVNSFHHQGVKTLGKGFQTAMVANDGTIEAIEIPGKRFVVGVQWHPEMMIEKYPEYLELFKTFIIHSQN